jgi:hypothetical protein
LLRSVDYRLAARIIRHGVSRPEEPLEQQGTEGATTLAGVVVYLGLSLLTLSLQWWILSRPKVRASMVGRTLGDFEAWRVVGGIAMILFLLLVASGLLR